MKAQHFIIGLQHKIFHNRLALFVNNFGSNTGTCVNNCT